MFEIQLQRNRRRFDGMTGQEERDRSAGNRMSVPRAPAKNYHASHAEAPWQGGPWLQKRCRNDELVVEYPWGEGAGQPEKSKIVPKYARLGHESLGECPGAL